MNFSPFLIFYVSQFLTVSTFLTCVDCSLDYKFQKRCSHWSQRRNQSQFRHFSIGTWAPFFTFERGTKGIFFMMKKLSGVWSMFDRCIERSWRNWTMKQVTTITMVMKMSIIQQEKDGFGWINSTWLPLNGHSLDYFCGHRSGVEWIPRRIEKTCVPSCIPGDVLVTSWESEMSTTCVQRVMIMNQQGTYVTLFWMKSMFQTWHHSMWILNQWDTGWPWTL